MGVMAPVGVMGVMAPVGVMGVMASEGAMEVMASVGVMGVMADYSLNRHRYEIILLLLRSWLSRLHKQN